MTKPDLTALRRRLAAATAKHRTRDRQRANPLAELRAATPDARTPPPTEPQPESSS